jgi:hypothetical protein
MIDKPTEAAKQVGLHNAGLRQKMKLLTSMKI